MLGFNVTDPDAIVEHAYREIEALGSTDRLRTSLAAHAPYSVAPLVLRAIRKAVDRAPFAPCSVHLSESVEEVEFIRTGGGPLRRMLEDGGFWNAEWIAPGVSPVQFLDDSGFLDARVLAVHGVQMTPADLSRLASRGATLVTCPRSNGHTGAGAPPIEDFYASGVHVAVGTDSLASAPDLSVFAELATLRALAPSVPASALLASATIEGARALGFDADYGTIEPGKLARLVAVDIRAGAGDVEEYLVSGVHRDQIRWIEELSNVQTVQESISLLRSSASAIPCSPCRLRWRVRCWRRSTSLRTASGGGPLPGFLSPWWRLAVRRWDSIVSSTPGSTRSTRGRRVASCRAASCRAGKPSCLS